MENDVSARWEAVCCLLGGLRDVYSYLIGRDNCQHGGKNVRGASGRCCCWRQPSLRVVESWSVVECRGVWWNVVTGLQCDVACHSVSWRVVAGLQRRGTKLCRGELWWIILVTWFRK